MNWLLHILGLDNGSGFWYLLWSGPFADLGELTIIGGMIGLWRKHTCHVRGCWRFARHPVEGTAHVVCARHHPDGAPSHQDVIAASAAAKTPSTE